jgi:outer membrane protein
MLRRPRVQRLLLAAGNRGRGRLGLALLLALIAAITAAPAMAQQAAATRIAYVDMKRLIDDSPQVREARARLQREFDASIALLREDEQRVAALQSRLLTAEGEQAISLRAELDPLRRSVDRTRERLRSELESRSEQEVQRAWPVLNEAIAQYARSNDLDLVVSSGALYVSGRVDITDRVLDLLERERRLDGEP